MTTETKVGVFVIASLSILGAGAYSIHQIQSGSAQIEYKTRLRYAGGVTSGTAVLFGGIKVGQVIAVGPWSEDPTRIEIAFAVKSGTPLNRKSTATVGTVTVMTAPAIMISTGSNDAGLLSPGSVVPSAETVSLVELQGSVGKLAESADALISELQKEVPALSGDARTLLANLNKITGAQNQKRIDETLASLNTLLEKESPKITQLTDQISELTKHADTVIGSVQPVLTHVDHAVVNVDSTVDALRAPLSKDLADLDSTLQAAHTLVAGVQNIVGSNEDDIGETVRNLRSASENVRALTESIKQRPWSLIRTKQPADRKVPQ